MTSSIILMLLGNSAVVVVTIVVLRKAALARRRRERQALAGGTTPDDAGVAEFAVRGTLTRAGFLQGGYSKNSISPRFWVEPGAIRVRILKTWRLPFGEITQIDARKTMTGVALVFLSETGNRAFIVRFGEAALARAALSLVAAAIPLTKEAAVLRDGHARAAAPGLRRYRGPIQ
jgi:hypothetical protein